jgi:hypothetical protein
VDGRWQNTISFSGPEIKVISALRWKVDMLIPDSLVSRLSGSTAQPYSFFSFRLGL